MKRIGEYLLLAALLGLYACSKQEATESPKFNPKMIAAEADKGNLGPLKDLNAACSAEVEKIGNRAAACATQDEVGALRKPLKLRF